MPRIRCHYIDCVLLDDGYCGAAAIELDPDVGCMTYKRSDAFEIEGEWEEEEGDELEDWEELDLEDEDEDIWVDEEDEY